MANDPLSFRPIAAGDHLLLIDGSGYIFRAYHALPPLTRKSDGLPVGAVAGFCAMLWRLLRETDTTAVGIKPTHSAAIFDHSSITFRNAIFDGYKAHRPEAPADLVPQFALIREAVRAFNMPAIEKQGFEADDLIATYTAKARAAGAFVTIVSSDKDLMQLVEDDRVVLYDTMKDKRVRSEEVIEKFGVPPEKVVEVQALVGDSVDNVPGVPGIGVKTAAELITVFGDLETLLARVEEIKQPKRRESLITFTEQARLSRRLVLLDSNVPLDTPLEALGVRPIDASKAIGFMKAMEFATLTRRIAAATGADAAMVEASAIAVKGWPPGTEEKVPPSGDIFEEGTPHLPTDPLAGFYTPAMAVERARQKIGALPVDYAAYVTILHGETLDLVLQEARKRGVLAVDTETSSLDPMQAELVGISLSTLPGSGCYIPLGHHTGEENLLGGGLVPGQLPREAVLLRLKPILEDPAILKIGQNIKYDALIFARHGIAIAPFDDTMLISYVLDAGKGGHGMDELSEKWLGHTPIAYGDVAGRGRNHLGFARVPIEKATAYAAEDADITLRLWHVLKPRLVAEGLVTVYETLERPLVPVLAHMEQRGIKIDRQLLARLSGEFSSQMAEIEADVHRLAGESFNLGSPKQLGEILFDKLGLAGGKKTRTGAHATGADVLEELAAAGHDLPRRILDWRQLAKLKSTYTDALPGYVHPETGRVHTSFALASTTTGRLSSSEPNLQNIPIRTREGRQIRCAFVAAPGMKLVSADYSQIELRVLAHMADIGALRRAFADGIDIHAMTASEMFGVPIKGMDPMIRRRAKAINFGIIYGISAFGLANQLGIGREEAGDYIRRYFQKFPGIRDYMEWTKREAREKGYVTTLFGRRAHYPEINTSNPSMRAFMERAAINAPIQGTAADIIRRAMIRMEPALAEAGLGALLLLQVHDELVFDVPEAEVENTLPLICTVMESACEPAVSLSVPLVVEARAAANWEEAH